MTENTEELLDVYGSSLEELEHETGIVIDKSVELIKTTDNIVMEMASIETLANQM